MPRFPYQQLFTLPVFLGVASAIADLTVRFEPDKEYTDLALSGASTLSVQDDLLKRFEQHFKQLGKQYLAKDDVLAGIYAQSHQHPLHPQRVHSQNSLALPLDR
ncbi:MAG: hypothetical protein ACU836_16150 [Gammaproteobacteria bacterium]